MVTPQVQALLDSRPAEVGLDAALLSRARDYALTGGGSGQITRHQVPLRDVWQTRPAIPPAS